MLSAQEAEAARAKARDGNNSGTEARKGDEGKAAFEDMTDLENDEFVVSSFLLHIGINF